LDLLPVGFEEMKNLNRCACCLASRDLCPLKKKAEPFFPDAFGPNALKQFIVAFTMSLEKKTQVEERLAQSTFGAEEQRNQQTA
jgi:succinate dehydrogenase/fumarate reductase-like Fe-S protein